MDQREKRRIGIDGTVLKYIAVVAMFIDHLGYTAIEAGAIGLPVYQAMRNVGRISFPIFCLLLAAGFERTGNARRYLGRLFLFSVLSEIPFDLAINGASVDMSLQNTMGTLCIALLMLYLQKKVVSGPWEVFCKVLIVAACCGIAQVCRFDYGWEGPALVEAFSLISPRVYREGTKGKNKFFFYIFYPLHLLILWGFWRIVG